MMRESNTDRGERSAACGFALIVRTPSVGARAASAKPQAARWIALLALPLVFLVSGCGKPVFLGGDFPLAEHNQRPEDIKDFATLFTRNCQGCHGADGRLGGAPPLNDPLFLAIVPEAELRRVIREGRKDTLMPPFARNSGGPLTDEQVDILVRNLHDPGGDNVDWKKAKLPADTPDYLLADALKKGTKPGDVDQGSGVYAMSCVSCHGDKEKKGDEGPVLDPVFLALMSDQALRRIVITGRPDLGMPDYQSPREHQKNFTPLTNQDVADVVAFLISKRKPQ